MNDDAPGRAATAPDGGPDDAQPAWRRDFPIDSLEDDYRSRRDFTKLLTLTSLAFVAGQTWIALLAARRRARGAPPRLAIARLDELSPGGAKVFAYPAAGDACVLVRMRTGELVAYGQKCTHLSCPVIPRPDEGRFRCPCHEGSFDLRTGRVISGPPRRSLPRVTLDVVDGTIYATGLAEGIV
jgi:nitrite reductase/ring-hydroxylating ferredoxin subunit